MKLADLLRERQATVVVYDYCFSACASYLLVATNETYVVRDTIVAWHHTTVPLCVSLQGAMDDGPLRLEKTACPDADPEYRRAYSELERRHGDFFAPRLSNRSFRNPPQSFSIRKILRSMFEGTGDYPDVLWTWNPRYSAVTFKTKITYEAYPGSQAEVDAILSRMGFRDRILYDP